MFFVRSSSLLSVTMMMMMMMMMEVHSVGRKKKKKKKKKTERDSCTESKNKKRAYLSLFCVRVFVCVFKVTLCILYSRDQSLVNQICVRSTKREKRTEVYPKGTKRFAFF